VAFDSLTERLSATFKKLRQKGRLKESDVRDAMREVRLALLEADVNYKVAKDLVAAITEKAVGGTVLESLTPAQQVIKIVHDEMTAFMGSANVRINLTSRPPTVIMMCGLQGAGKTTHAGKLARFFKEQGKRPLLVACDIYRPAAIEQLEVVGKSVGVPVFTMGQENPLLIAQKALARAKDYGDDIVILDTAGRLHIDQTLMDELGQIKSAIRPHEILLVVDAMTGQDAVTVAQSFDEQLGIDGVILTKLDGDTRGGAALSVRAVTGKPIKFAGTGEKMSDLEPFHPDRMASRILGMGDMMTLIEKAQTQVDLKEAEKMQQKLQKNSFDMNDLLEQMKQIQSMGPLGQVLGMLPGVKIKDEDAEQGERELRRVEAIIQSMTKQERAKPAIINPSRKRRIAAGSGTQVEDVNRVLRQFNQIQKMMKQMMGPQKKGKRGRGKLPFGLGDIPPGFIK
jgi:signal recognition particle subunit SRP54